MNRVSPFLRDLLFTAVTTVAHVVSVVILVGILGVRLGPAGLGAFYLVRRVVASALPVVTVGMEIAFPRALGYASGRAVPRERAIVGACLLTVAGLLAVCVPAFAWSNWLSHALFGPGVERGLLIALLLSLVGEAIYQLFFGYFRGINRIVVAGVANLTIRSAGPVVLALTVGEDGVVAVVTAIALLTLTSAAPVVVLFVRAARTVGREAMAAVGELFPYAAPRMVALVLRSALLTLGPLLASAIGSLADAADFAVAQALLRAAEGGLVAFGLVVLPRAAARSGAGDEALIASRVSDLVVLLVHVGSFVTVHVILWADVLIASWLGPEFESAIPLTRVTVLALLPYTLFALTSPVLDAVERKGFNTRNLAAGVMVAAVTGVGLALAGYDQVGLGVGMALGWGVTGFLTLRSLNRRLHISPREWFSFRLVAANGVLAAASILVHAASATSPVALVAEALLWAAYGLYLWFVIDPPWKGSLIALLRSGGTRAR